MPYNPGVQSIGGQLIGQAIGGMGESFARGIQQYQQNKDMADKAIGAFEGAARANPDMLQHLLDDKANPEIKNSYNKLQKGGRVGFQDAAKLATFANSYVMNKQEQQQAQIRQQGIDQYNTNKAAQDASNARAAQLSRYSQGEGVGFYAPQAKAAMDAQLATPVGQLAAQTYQYTGRGPTGGDIADITKAKIMTDARAAAAVHNPPQNFMNISPMSVDGKFVGFSVFDKTTGETKLHDTANNKLVPLPAKAEPITATGLQKIIPDNPTFRKYKEDVTNSEISLNAMDRYFKSVGSSNTGFQRIADQFSAGIKTLTGAAKNPLTQEEISQAMAKGELQGLLGKLRTTVLGPGPLTETDALRILQRVGGDVNMLQNPTVVKQALSEIYSDRFRQYDDDLKFYNAGVDSYYGEHGFAKKEPIKFSSDFNNLNAPPAPAAPAAGPFAGKSTADLEAELKALKGGQTP